MPTDGLYTSDTDEAFFSAIGKLVVSWAHLEAGLQATIEIVHFSLKDVLHEQSLPRPLNKKIAYLRRSVKLLLSETEATPWLKFFDDVARESDVRHDIIHGFIIEQAEGTGAANAVRAIYEKNGTRLKKIDLTTSTILQAAIRAQALASKALAFPAAVHDAVRHAQRTT